MKAIAVSLLACVLVPVLALAQEGQAQGQANLNTITSVNVRGGTVEIVGTKKPNFTTFTMTDPPRLVIDISEAVFSGVKEDVSVGNGTITGVRTASYGSDESAIARVLIGYEREVETDIQTTGNSLVVSVVGGGGVAAAASPAAPAETGTAPGGTAPGGAAPGGAAPGGTAPGGAAPGGTAEQAAVAAQADRQQQERAAAQATAAAQADRQQQERAAADAAAQARTDAEAQRQAQARAEADRKAQEESARVAAQQAEQQRLQAERAAKDATAAAEKQRREEEARAAAEDRRRQQSEERQARLAQAETQRRPAQGERPAVSSRRKTMTLVGFKQEATASRVFVRTNEPVSFNVTEGDNLVVLELEDTRIDMENNARALDTSFFDTAVAAVDADAGPSRTVRVAIRLKEQVPYRTHQEGNELFIEFQRPARR